MRCVLNDGRHGKIFCGPFFKQTFACVMLIPRSLIGERLLLDTVLSIFYHDCLSNYYPYIHCFVPKALCCVVNGAAGGILVRSPDLLSLVLAGDSVVFPTWLTIVFYLPYCASQARL